MYFVSNQEIFIVIFCYHKKRKLKEMGIGEKIKELRKARGWSQYVLGEKLGVQKSAIR